QVAGEQVRIGVPPAAGGALALDLPRLLAVDVDVDDLPAVLLRLTDDGGSGAHGSPQRGGAGMTALWRISHPVDAAHATPCRPPRRAFDVPGTRSSPRPPRRW